MHFTVADYVVFALLLVASAGIGLFYAFSGGRQRTTQVGFGIRRLLCFFVCLFFLLTILSLLLPYTLSEYRISFKCIFSVCSHNV